MGKKNLKVKCINCKGRRACHDETIAWIFIIIGLISTVAIRVVTILMNFSELYGKISWYIGVIGFILFFLYKYKVFKQRADYIDQIKLIEKITNNDPLSSDEREGILIILCNIRSNKERINFFFIFVASFMSLLLALYFDFMH